MAVRTGTQLLTDVSAIVAVLDAAIASPTQATHDAIVAACDMVLTNARDSVAIRETASTHGNASGTPAADFRALVEDLKSDVLAIAARARSRTRRSARLAARTEW